MVSIAPLHSASQIKTKNRRPLKKNEVEGRVSFFISTNSFNTMSLQAGAFWGLSDNDAVGCTFNKFPILPSSLSYVRYWQSGNSYWNYQFHINSILPGDFNPPFETDLALSKINNSSVYSFKLGLGAYPTLIMSYLSGQHEEYNAFVPVISYSFQNPTIEDSRVMWVYLDDNRWPEKSMAPALIEVNMKKAVEEFNKGKDLVLISDKDLIERSLKNINPITDDLFFSIGHSWR